MATEGRLRVVVSGPLVGDAIEVLAESFDVTTTTTGFADIDLTAVDGVLSLLRDPVDATFLARARRLKVVANVAVGFDNIDLAACRARGVVVTNTPDVLTEATADLAFGLLLDAARRITEGDRLIRAGGWTGFSQTFHLGNRVHGMKLGILGFGRIGRAMARRARGFGMHVGYTNRTRLAEPLERALGATWVPTVEELVATSEAVSIHCPLTPETRGLFDAALLAKMKPGAVLINTARGAIVDEAALAHALEHGPLAAAGLDAFADEPHVHPALLARVNVVLTPHIGSAEADTRTAMASTAAANVIAVLHGQQPLTPVASGR